MRTLKIIIFICVVIVVWFWPNIYGNYRFKQYCARESGLKIYGEVLRDQGWLAASNDLVDYREPFSLGHAAFVRYKAKKGDWFDVYIKRNPWPKDPDYIFQPVDFKKEVMYELKISSEYVPNELRLSTSIDEIYSVKENRILVQYVSFGYSQFEQKNTILNAPSGVVCPDDNSREKFLNIVK